MSKMIERQVADENFGHVIGLLGPCAAFVEDAVRKGYRLRDDDCNLIQIPTEIALAFAKHHLTDEGPLGDGARRCFEVLAMFRAARDEKADAGEKAKTADLLEPA